VPDLQPVDAGHGLTAGTAGQRLTGLRRRVTRPPLCQDHLARPRLYRILDEAVGGGLSLVVAPAGFGKSTMLSGWATTASRPVAWLTLSREDNDIIGFVRALTVAVRTVAPAFDSQLQIMVQVADRLDPEALAAEIVRDLADLPHDVTLVIDEYEVIDDPAVHALVAAALRMISSNVRVVVASRTTPPLRVARLRTLGRVVDVGPDELRFRPDEVRAFFADATDVELPATTIQELSDRLEGWPSCLRLAAQMLSGDADPVRLVERFRRRPLHRIEEYLFEEILALQPAPVQDFLLRTAIVDEVCADLCDALLQEDTAMVGSASILGYLQQQLRLIDRVDETGDWFRYPSVFRDALRRRLRYQIPSRSIVELRRRASEWLATHNLVASAMEQALAAGDAVRAAELLEQNVARLLAQGDYLALQRQLRMIPAELANTRPRLLLARAWTLSFVSRYDAIRPVLEQVEALLKGNDGDLAPAVDAMRAEVALLRALVAMIDGDGQRLLALGRPAYDRLPRELEYARGLAAAWIGVGHHFVGEPEAATRFLDGVYRESAGGGRFAEFAVHWARAWIALMSARPELAHQEATLLAAAAVDRVPLMYAWARYFLGLACYELNRLTEAREHFLAVDLHRDVSHRLLLRNSLIGLALIDHALGDLTGAFATVQAMRDVPDFAQNERNIAVIDIVESLLACEAGDLDTARTQLSSRGAHMLRVSLETLSLSPSRTRARLLLALGDADEAALALDTLEAAARSVNDQSQLIGLQAVRALQHQASGDPGTALQLARSAVASAERGGLVRTFVDLGQPMRGLLVELDRQAISSSEYLIRLIEAFPTAAGLAVQATPSRCGTRIGPELTESLTWREAEILRLLESRLSNKEIAATLLISTETVKKHISNIFQKLRVDGRREAVARAYALGILPISIPDLGAGQESRPNVSTG
jgi:LuxR family transcriptional regulator, maltose regulon positive regulatory protein